MFFKCYCFDIILHVSPLLYLLNISEDRPSSTSTMDRRSKSSTFHVERFGLRGKAPQPPTHHWFTKSSAVAVGGFTHGPAGHEIRHTAVRALAVVAARAAARPGDRARLSVWGVCSTWGGFFIVSSMVFMAERMSCCTKEEHSCFWENLCVHLVNTCTVNMSWVHAKVPQHWNVTMPLSMAFLIHMFLHRLFVNKIRGLT